MGYKNRSLKNYLDDLAAKLPAPGGGSAAAMTAAMACALISMVVNFTLGKPKYIKYEEELKEILRRSEKLRKEFLELVDLDVLAYRSKDLKKALDVPLKVCRLCFEALELCPGLIKKGNINLISDIGIAVVFLEASFISAKLNVDINLKLIDSLKLSSSWAKQGVFPQSVSSRAKRGILKELSKKEKIIKRIREDTEVKCGKIIRG